MNNKNLTPAQQIYAKVCDIEKKLDQLLQQKAVPAPEPERRIYCRSSGWRMHPTICPALRRAICSTPCRASPS